MPEQTKIEPLSATECETLGEAMWELIKQYPKQDNDPDVTAKYDELDAGVSLAVLVLGGRYKEKFISGGFIGEATFRVAYKSNPKTSPQRINSQAFVGRIMQWLEHTENLPKLTDNRTITKITASGTGELPYKDDTGQDKSTVYAVDAVMEYRKKGEYK